MAPETGGKGGGGFPWIRCFGDGGFGGGGIYRRQRVLHRMFLADLAGLDLVGAVGQGVVSFLGWGQARATPSSLGEEAALERLLWL